MTTHEIYYTPRIRHLIKNSEGKYSITKERPKGLCCAFVLKKEEGVVKCFFEAFTMGEKNRTWVEASKHEEGEKFLLEEVGIGNWNDFYNKHDEGEEYLVFYIQGGVI